MNVFNGWAETNFASQWCFENFVQVGWYLQGWQLTAVLSSVSPRCLLQTGECLQRFLQGGCALAQGVCFKQQQQLQMQLFDPACNLFFP